MSVTDGTGITRESDTNWVRSLFGAPKMVSSRNLRQRLFSNVQLNFADTTVGGNIAINTPPQASRFSDPSVGGLFANPKLRAVSSNGVVKDSDAKSAWEQETNVGSYSLGAYYHEAIQENGQYIHCRFGKPKYAGTVAFFTGAYDANLAYLAKTGDYSGMFRKFSGILGATAIWAALGTVPFAALMIVPRIIGVFINSDTSKYYYVKPTMHLYLRTVQSIINTQLIHYRLTPITTLEHMGTQFKGINDPANKYYEDASELYSLLPDIWKDNGMFDIYKMISRYQTLANYQARTLDKIYADATDADDMNSKLDSWLQNARYNKSILEQEKNILSLSDLERYALGNGGYQAKDVEDAAEVQAKSLAQTEANYNNTMTSNDAAKSQAKGSSDTVEQTQEVKETSTWGDMFGAMLDTAADWAKDFTEQQAAELHDSAQFVSWRINAKESVNWSFSNSTKEPEIAGTVNSITAKARSIEVNAADGYTGIGFVDAVVKGAKGLLSATAETLNITGLMGLYSSSIIDFPEVWDSSSMGSQEFTFTIPCRCWSGNDLDVFQDIILPTSFWISAVCPLSTGKQSYTHPFYLEAYVRGRFAGRNCIVTNVSFTAGAGGMGWRQDGVPLSMDINVTIRDLSKVMHMPINTDPSLWDTDNKFSDFMGTLGAQSLHERIYGVDKAIFNLNKWKMSARSFWSVGNFSNYITDLAPARVLSAFTSGSSIG